MSEKKFDLGSYVEVKDRIAVLLDLFPQARITTTYELTREPDDKPKVIARALVYRTIEDPIPVTGTSWMYLPGKTSYTLGSEIENAETSAVGRAIGMMGILIDRSIATSNEIEGKASDGRQPPPPPHELTPILVGPWNGTGKVIVRKSGPADGNIRQGPDGPYVIVAFSTVDDQTIPQVMASGALALDLIDAAGAELNGMVATIAGDLYRIPWDKDGKTMPPFQRLHLTHIKTMAWSLPVPGQSGPGLFDPADEAELDAAVLA